jgi:hypothetical protein
VRGLLVVLVLAATAFVAWPSSPSARVGQCGLPETGAQWIDVAGGDWWKRVFARPGLVMAVGSISATGGPDVPTQLRAAGANTVYWDNYLNKRVGTPSKPADPSTIVDKANKVFDYAVKVSGCSTPLMGENELFGAKLPTPWSATNSQYRANVLTFLQTLAARGARPFLAVPTVPNRDGDAKTWWQQVSQVADIVQEVYFSSPQIYSAGVIHGNRILRMSFREAIAWYTDIGIPTARLGIFVGFQTTKGTGGREGLKPASSWFRVTKWQALAAKQVSRELQIGSVWSWGWGAWSTRPGEYDPDKPAAACVYLWARNPSLCKGPAAAGSGFNASLTEGQIVLPRGVQCRIGHALIGGQSLDDLANALGDREVAYTVLLARAVADQQAQTTTEKVLGAERRLVAVNFEGSRAAYLEELTTERLSQALARRLIGDELRRQQIEGRMPIGQRYGGEIRARYAANAGAAARRVRVTPAAPWLGGEREGIAFEPFAPKSIFSLATGQSGFASTLSATYKVSPLSGLKPLGRFGLDEARPAIRASIAADRQAAAFQAWMLKAQRKAVYDAICRRDAFPKRASVDLPKLFPFLDFAEE